MNRRTTFAFLFVILVLRAIPALGQTVQFTHHGNLGFGANGNSYDIQLTLFDTPAAGTGTQQGATFQQLSVQMTDGEFTVQPDFGAALFTGAELYLETGWRVSGGGAFTALSTRERITSVYANRSLSAATADVATNATQLGGLPATSFIQNGTSQQTSTNFNITGNGVAGFLGANIVNADTQINLGSSRVLSAPNGNLCIGLGAGASNPTGTQNTFVGPSAGSHNISGWANSFFGQNVGYSNDSGTNNSFFGSYAGYFNVTGGYNAFFGEYAGYKNTAGGNSFFGAGAGHQNVAGTGNSFFGLTTGGSNTSGSYNSYFGHNTVLNATTGDSNTIIGAEAGNGVVTSDHNTLLGFATGLSNGISNATAIGSNAFVAQSNSLVLGSIGGIYNATQGTLVGIGTTSPRFRLHIVDPWNLGLRVQTNFAGGKVASFGGNGDFEIDAPGIVGGRFDVKENGDIGIGTFIPAARLHVKVSSGNVLIGDAGCPGSGGIGFGTSMSGCSNYSLLGEGVHTYINRPGGGSIFFREANTTQMTINPGGTVSINTLGAAGSTQLCRNSSNQISTCSSSLRYKENIAPFQAGLSLIDRLRPITFNWKANGEADFGLGAEDVARIEPLLVTHNEKGEVEGVKYDRVSVVLLNAIKEQQTQIESLKRIVCLDHPNAEMCVAAARTIRVSENK